MLATVDVSNIAASKALLILAVESGRYFSWSGVVRVGGCFAGLGVLVSLMAGVSRTVFSMAANSHLPSLLSSVSLHTRVPHRAEIMVGAIAAALLVVTLFYLVKKKVSLFRE